MLLDALPAPGFSAAIFLLPTLFLVGLLYGLGWRKLHRRGLFKLAPGLWRAAAFYGGLLTVALALFSGLAELGHRLLTAHMLQHLLLMSVAAPLLVLGRPFPTVFVGLPSSLQQGIGRKTPLWGGLRAVGRVATFAPVAVVAYVGVLWLWHIPAAFQAALTVPVLHYLQHATFLGVGMLFWWIIIQPGRRYTGFTLPWRMVVLFAVLLADSLAGMVLVAVPFTLYPYYEGLTAMWGIDSAVIDQQAAGALMAGFNGLVYVGALTLLFFSYLREEEERARQEEAPPVPKILKEV